MLEGITLDSTSDMVADSQIDAKLRCSVGTPDTLTISIRYAEEV